jgi:hypothetical protein
MLPAQEVTMHGVVVDVRFDNTHLFLNLSDGQAVRFPLNWFPVLKVATATEREHFAISLDRQQLFWPEIDEDLNVAALLSFLSSTIRRERFYTSFRLRAHRPLG